MGFVVLIFWVISLFDAGQSLWAGEYLRGTMALLGSLLAFAAGAGFRGALHQRNPLLPSALIGIAIFGASLAVMQFFDLTIDLVDGRVWALIGAAVGFISAKKEDALPGGQGAGATKEYATEATLDDFFGVVGAYGQIMEKDPDTAFPLTKLPLPKEQMKKVLKLVWVAVDHQSGKDAVEAGYSHLAYFREDVHAPTSRGFEELEAATRKEALSTDAVNTFSDRMSLFETITAESLALAQEFEEFKNSLTD